MIGAENLITRFFAPISQTTNEHEAFFYVFLYDHIPYLMLYCQKSTGDHIDKPGNIDGVISPIYTREL